AARFHPAQPRHAHRAVLRRQHRPVRAALADRRQLPGLWLRAGRGLLCHHLARLLHRGHGVERQEVLRLRHRFGEDTEGPEEVTKVCVISSCCPASCATTTCGPTWSRVSPHSARSTTATSTRTRRSKAWRSGCSIPRPIASCWWASR